MCSTQAAVAVTPLESLLQAIEEYVGVPTLELTPADLGDHLIRLRHGLDLLELNFASCAATFASTDEYERQGSVSAIDWIRHHCHMSGHAAGRAVSAGEQVFRLPVSVAALDAGDIGFAHFALLAATARALTAKPVSASLDASLSADQPNPADPSSPASASPFDERPLVGLAREHSVGLFGFDCTRARHAYDAAAVLAEHVSAAERNRCEFIPCEGGFMAMRGYFDPIAAATIKTDVLPLAKPSGAGDGRPLPRRLADALVEIASHP